MSRFFLWFGISLLLFILIFFPIVTEIDAHFDIREKKVGFSIFFYRLFKIFGGYINTYPGGIAMHLSRKKAILFPYRNMKEDGKRFSFFKSVKPIYTRITTETGVEYLLPITAITLFLQAISLTKKPKIENNLWLTDGDVLKISARVAFYFSLYTLLCNFIKFLKEKITLLWRKNTKKSII